MKWDSHTLQVARTGEEFFVSKVIKIYAIAYDIYPGLGEDGNFEEAMVAYDEKLVKIMDKIKNYINEF